MSGPPSPVVWREDGLPGSALYGDVYFSSEDGLAESRAVFLAGCGLPDAWIGRRRFTVGELGFGTGLNIAALLSLWRATRAVGQHLHIFSVEAHPMSREDAARALNHWPELAEEAEALLTAWPGKARGVHRIDLPGLSATFDLAVMDAREALAGWGGPADAWFLDGFAPAANPAMWSDDLMGLVAARSAPGARAATFTVAGQVRRGLAAAGFAVEKKPGFGRKRERLEARLPGEAIDPGAARVAVIGAGIAGASVARAVRALGGEAVVFDPRGPAGGASGNRAGLMTPRLDSGDGPPARLYAQAWRRARQLYETVPEAILGRGARHFAGGDRDPPRFARIAADDLFEPGEMIAEPDAMRMPGALSLDPGRAVEAWTGEVRREAVVPAELEGFDAVVVCTGHLAAQLGLPLQAVRGQASFATGATLAEALSGDGYAAPARGGVMFGATHQRDDADERCRPEDDAANFETLRRMAPDLAEQIVGQPLEGRASIRAGAPDRLPVAGPVPGQAGIFVLSGLGGRGLCLAPLLGEHLAALALGTPSPLPADIAAAVDPGRFEARARRRTSKPSPR